MKKNPGRKQRREFARQHTKKRGDLTRKSTHKMRTHMGMEKQARKSPEQKKVDAAVKDELLNKFAPKVTKPENVITVPEEKSYRCSKCNRNHRPGSAIYEKHLEHAE